jgi:uncharacterized SAM-binding protein YcdF (DUF218 family)
MMDVLRKWTPRALLLGAFAGFLWLSSLAVTIMQYGQLSDTGQADAAVVLGAAVYRGNPSPVFRERIKHAVALYQDGRVDFLIFTGGVGWGDDMAEGLVGKQYAMELGVPEAAIFYEDQSLDTLGNLNGAAAIMAAQGIETVLIVSDPLHMFRAMALALDLGLEASPSPTPTSRYRSPRSQAPFLLRELLYAARYPADIGLLHAAAGVTP